MTSNAPPILAIFGAGQRVGASIARKFRANGFQIALVSRNKPPGTNIEGQHHVQGDFSGPTSVVAAYQTIRRELGVPSVVVYNASANVAANDAANPATLSLESLYKDLSINTFSVLTTANEAVKGFRELPSDVPKIFIFTGNILNQTGVTIPRMLSAGMGKSATAHFIATASSAYAEEGFSFYYADERKQDGAPVYNAIDGDAHADMYWQLATGNKSTTPWLVTFVKGEGYRNFSANK